MCLQIAGGGIIRTLRVLSRRHYKPPRHRLWRTITVGYCPPPDTSLFSLGEKREEGGGPPQHSLPCQGQRQGIAGGAFLSPPVAASGVAADMPHWRHIGHAATPQPPLGGETPEAASPPRRRKKEPRWRPRSI